MKFEVIVGNIGTVYHGHDEADANDHFKEYREISLHHKGHRGFGEQVTLFKDGEIVSEHNPYSDEEEDTDTCTNPNGHEWSVPETESDRCYCIYCGADGDA